MKTDPFEYRLDLVQARVGTPFSVVVGAMDGLTFDQLGPMIKEKGWPALMLEPMPSAFKELEKNFKGCENVHLVNKAVFKTRGLTPMMYVDPAAYHKDPNNAWMQGISTLNQDIGDMSQIPEEFIITDMVMCDTLPNILEGEKVPRVNILQIDTEGYDAKVLFQFPFELYQPEFIVMEFSHVTVEEFRKTQAVLSKMGYAMVEHGRDLLATKNI